jgi:CrcB protein
VQETVRLLLWVALGSAAGGMLRFLVSGVVARTVGETFPWGTLVVNATGAVAIGILAAATQADPVFVGARPHGWALMVTGVLGSYTTVSSFSLQTLTLLRDGSHARAAGNVLLSLLLCLGGVAAGFAAATALLGAAP